MRVRLLNVINKPLSRKPSNDFISTVPCVATSEVSRGFRQISVFVNNLHHLKSVTFRQFKILEIVCRRDRHGSASKIHFRGRIDNDTRLHRAVDPLDIKTLSDQIFVTSVVRVHDKNLVQKFRFWTRGANDNRPVFKIVKFGFLLFVFDLVIGKSGLATRAPIHDAIPAVHESVVVHHFKHRAHGATWSFIHRVGLTRPIARSAHLPHLIADRVLRRRNELAHARQKRLAAEIVLRLPFLSQNLLHLRICRNRRMVCPRDPKSSFPTHACKTYHDVLKRQHDRMAHVQRAGGVWWRKNDGKRLTTRLKIRQIFRTKKPAFFPCGVDRLFDGLRFVGLGNVRLVHRYA